MSNPLSSRSMLGLPERTRLESAVCKSEMAMQFLVAAQNSAIEEGDKSLRWSLDNVIDAVTELRLLAEEAAATLPSDPAK